jgi:hypothetical protein
MDLLFSSNNIFPPPSTGEGAGGGERRFAPHFRKGGEGGFEKYGENSLPTIVY